MYIAQHQDTEQQKQKNIYIKDNYDKTCTLCYIGPVLMISYPPDNRAKIVADPTTNHGKYGFLTVIHRENGIIWTR